MGRFSDALLAVKRSWASKSIPPTPWRLQGNDPYVSLDEVPMIAANMVAGRPWRQGLNAMWTHPAHVTTVLPRVESRKLW